MSDNFINPKLLDINFYLHSMSMYLRNSYGMEERCKLYYDILTNVIDTADTMFDRMNIFYYENENDNYFTKNYISAGYVSADDYKTGTSDSVLDGIGAIFGLKRQVRVKYSPSVGDSVDEIITLNNFEFLIYIQASIAKNNYDGTNKSLRQYYRGTSLFGYDRYSEKVYDQNQEFISAYLNHIRKKSFLTELKIAYIAGEDPLTVKIFLGYEKANEEKNIKHLFLSGLLTIESLGITYEKIIGNEFEYASWVDDILIENLEEPYTKYYFEQNDIVYIYAEYNASEGLSFTSNEDGTCVLSGIGTCTDINIIVPDKSPLGDTVTSVAENAFENNTQITSIILPDSITSIGNSVFSGCSSLQSITIPFVGDRAGVTSSDTYQYPFGYIFGTSSYTGSTEVQQYYYGDDTSSTTSSYYYIPASLRSVTVTGGNILYGAFWNCSMLTSVEIPSSVTSIGQYAFSKCTSLTSITIPSSVTSIGNRAFWDCSNLTSIVIPSSVTSIGNYAFQNCNSLTSITLGKGVTWIGSNAFQNCSRLIEVKNLSSLNIQAGYSSYGYVGYYAKRVYSEGESYLHTTDDGYVFYDDDENVYLVQYIGNETALTLPDTYNEKNYQINQYAFEDCTSLTNVIISSAVTSIGYGAFDGCTSLVRVTFGENSQLTSIGDYAFYFCTSLSDFDCQQLNDVPTITTTSFRSGGFTIWVKYTLLSAFRTATNWASYAFYIHCNYPITVNTPTLNYSPSNNTISSLTGAETIITFSPKISGQSLPENLIVTNATGNWNQSTGELTITNPSDAVEVSEVPPSLRFTSNGDSTCYVSGIGDFSSDTSITIPTESPSGDSVTAIGQEAFFNCTNLEQVSFESGSSITQIGNSAFKGCVNLKFVLQFPDSITTIEDYAFANCGNSLSIKLSDNLTSIGKDIFSNTTVVLGSSDYIKSNNLNNILLKRTFDKTVSSYIIDSNCKFVYENAFENCVNLTTISFPVSVVYIGDGVLSGCISLSSITSSSANYSVSVDSSTYWLIENSTRKLLAYCGQSATNITTPPSVEVISAESFKGNDTIERVTVSSGVTTISSNAFANCTNLTSVSIASSVATIEEGAFSGCESLETLNIPNAVETIPSNMVSGCTALTNITIPNSIKVIGERAFYNTGLENVTIQDESLLEDIQDGAFEECSSLESFYCGSVHLDSIGANSFKNCSQMQNLNLPSVAFVVQSNSFVGCTSLVYVFAPSNVMSKIPTNSIEYAYFKNGNNTIETGTFYNCSNLQTVFISDGILLVGENAFSNCSGLNNVTWLAKITSNIPQLDVNAFSSISSSCKFYVYNPILTNYQSSWSAFASKLVGGYDITVKYEWDSVRETSEGTIVANNYYEYSYEGNVGSYTLFWDLILGRSQDSPFVIPNVSNITITQTDGNIKYKLSATDEFSGMTTLTTTSVTLTPTANQYLLLQIPYDS